MKISASTNANSPSCRYATAHGYRNTASTSKITNSSAEDVVAHVVAHLRIADRHHAALVDRRLDRVRRARADLEDAERHGSNDGDEREDNGEHEKEAGPSELLDHGRRSVRLCEFRRYWRRRISQPPTPDNTNRLVGNLIRALKTASLQAFLVGSYPRCAPTSQVRDFPADSSNSREGNCQVGGINVPPHPRRRRHTQLPGRRCGNRRAVGVGPLSPAYPQR